MKREEMDNKKMDGTNDTHIDYDGEIVKLTPRGFWSDFDNLYVIDNPGHGSCLFYSVVQGIYPQFIQGYDDSLEFVINQEKYIQHLREDMADDLPRKSNHDIDDSLSWYDILLGGNIRDKSKDIPNLTLENLQEKLRNGSTPDIESEVFIELMSKMFNVDIYIIDDNSMDLVILDEDIYYEGRLSIILYLKYEHYRLVIHRNDRDHYALNFESSHPLIEKMKLRLKKK